MSQAENNVGWVSDSVTQQIQDQGAEYRVVGVMSGYAPLTRPTELPQGWLHTNLGSVVDYGKVGKAEPNSITDDTWVLELEDIERDSSKILQRLYFRDRQSKSTKNKFKKGDVLYGKLRPYLNKVVVADLDGVCTTEIIPLSGDENLNNLYLFYWLKHPEFLAYVSEVGYGVNMPRLGTKDGIAAPFVLAPLAEQQQIAAKLDELLAQVDTLKTRLDTLPKILKRYRQSVLAAAVSGRLLENRYDDNDAIKATSCLKKLGKITGGKTPSKSNPMFWTNGSIPWVSPKDMKVLEIDSSEDTITELALSKGGMNVIPKNSILMVTRSGILAHSFPVAITKVEVTINQDIKAFIPDTKKILPMFASILMRGLTTRVLHECSKMGTTVSSVETTLLENLEFSLPAIEEQTEIVNRVEQLFTYADQIEQRVKDAQARVNQLTQAILAKAFRGELTADWREHNPDLISGENSAAALLAKIKAEREKIKHKKLK
ncbi:restriction endonuclease subunit S [Methylovulum miyakonense]|uniref:restriction endonuclease subunit S n=1 Tax=Methylovulum miyakonense TaxID=645578 RepID=UPI00037B676F|nr:restriction endonuclease subunit S [Methylovulum miyakonense]